MNELKPAVETKKEAEILAKLELVRDKLYKLREFLNPILWNAPQDEAIDSEPTNSSEVMYKINKIGEQINFITDDVDIN